MNLIAPKEFHLAFQKLGYVMEDRNVLIAAMKKMISVVRMCVCISQNSLYSVAFCSTLGNWICDEEQFQCGKNYPKCIAIAQVCNDNKDCSDGSDEIPQLCGKKFNFLTSLFFILIFLRKQSTFSYFCVDCCDLVTVSYTNNNTEVYQVQPELFTTYEKQSRKKNRKPHYLSLNGEFALAYSECGFWVIQKEENR